MQTKIHSLRLKPQSDLKKSLLQFLKKNKIQAGVLLSSVGSLGTAEIRFADANKAKKIKGPFEIIHINGTVSMHGCHLHISVADKKGRFLGGHLMDGNLIHTTCELVILEIKTQVFKRSLDTQTQYNELEIHKL